MTTCDIHINGLAKPTGQSLRTSTEELWNKCSAGLLDETNMSITSMGTSATIALRTLNLSRHLNTRNGTIVRNTRSLGHARFAEQCSLRHLQSVEEGSALVQTDVVTFSFPGQNGSQSRAGQSTAPMLSRAKRQSELNSQVAQTIIQAMIQSEANE